MWRFRQGRYFARWLAAVAVGAWLTWGCHSGDLFDLNVGWGGRGGGGENAPAGFGGAVTPSKSGGGTWAGGLPSRADASGGDGGFGGAEAPGGSGAQGDPDGDRVPVSKGRLGFNPSACWVWQADTVDFEEWNATRLEYEGILTEWQGASGLRIDWQGQCTEDPGKSADIRILLDYRSAHAATIRGCERADRLGPWAAYPDEVSSFVDCEWNMSLPAGLRLNSSVLHAGGHALGFAHAHVGSGSAFDKASGCPLEGSDSSNPYLDLYDAAGVMHSGQTSQLGYLGNPWLTCESALLATAPERQMVFDELSSGDLLGIEMLYPASFRHSLGGTGWLTVAGRPTFRSDTPVRLQTEWISRGANRDWFQESLWTYNEGEGELAPSYEAVSELAPALAAGLQVSYSFQDPFGDLHSLTETLHVSDALHTAIVTAISP